MRKNIASRPFAKETHVPYDLVTEYLLDIFSNAKKEDGYVCIRSGVGTKAEQSWIDVANLESNLKLELSRHDCRDCYFSFSTFRKSAHPCRTEERITNIFAWSIDVDYKNEGAHPLDVYQHILENVRIPLPNYVEYGHRLRLIYLFGEPLRLYPKQRASLLRGYNLVQKVFCRRINEELGFLGEPFGAEANSAGSFFRIPGSINTKDSSVIQIEHVTSERLTIQELFDEWITDKDTDPSGCKSEWYSTWKARKEAPKQKTVPQFSTCTLWERRMATFKKLQKCGDVPRKRLCFLYGVSLQQLGMVSNWDELHRELLAFNRNFDHPLPEKEIASRYRTLLSKSYKFRDGTIAQMLEVDREYFAGISQKERDEKRYQQKRNSQIGKGKAKYQQMEERQKCVAKMLQNGESIASIAKKLRASLSTIKRDARKIREALLQKQTAPHAHSGLKHANAFFRLLGADAPLLSALLPAMGGYIGLHANTSQDSVVVYPAALSGVP